MHNTEEVEISPTPKIWNTVNFPKKFFHNMLHQYDLIGFHVTMESYCYLKGVKKSIKKCKMGVFPYLNKPSKRVILLGP